MDADDDPCLFDSFALHCCHDARAERSLGAMKWHISDYCPRPNSIQVLCGCCGTTYYSFPSLTAHVNQRGFRRRSSRIPNYDPLFFDPRVYLPGSARPRSPPSATVTSYAINPDVPQSGLLASSSGDPLESQSFNVIPPTPSFPAIRSSTSSLPSGEIQSSFLPEPVIHIPYPTQSQWSPSRFVTVRSARASLHSSPGFSEPPPGPMTSTTRQRTSSPSSSFKFPTLGYRPVTTPPPTQSTQTQMTIPEFPSRTPTSYIPVSSAQLISTLALHLQWQSSILSHILPTVSSISSIDTLDHSFRHMLIHSPVWPSVQEDTLTMSLFDLITILIPIYAALVLRSSHFR